MDVVVDGPSYGYRIAQHLEKDWSSAAVHKALSRLLEQGLIEAAGEDGLRRPRKWYRATAIGEARNAEHLAERLDAREELLGALLRMRPSRLLAVLDEYEKRVLEEVGAAPRRAEDPLRDLLAQERMLVNEARLKWVALARERVGDASRSG